MGVELTRILVPMDFSDESSRAAEYALALAARLGASVELLHVVEDPITSGAWGAEAYIVNIPGLIAQLEEEAKRRLASVKAGYDAGGVPIETRVITGSPARAIVAIAEGEHCGLIVMGTHGRTGLSHMLMGSVAERVVRTAPCPVLTVRAEKRPDDATKAKALEIVAS